jgi:hypothetical protein
MLCPHPPISPKKNGRSPNEGVCVALKFKCDKCGQQVVSRALKYGERFDCPHCKGKAVVPIDADEVEGVASSWDKPGNVSAGLHSNRTNHGAGALRICAAFVLVAGVLVSCLSLLRGDYQAAAGTFVAGLFGFLTLRGFASVIELLEALSAKATKATRLLAELAENAKSGTVARE